MNIDYCFRSSLQRGLIEVAQSKEDIRPSSVLQPQAIWLQTKRKNALINKDRAEKICEMCLELTIKIS